MSAMLFRPRYLNSSVPGQNGRHFGRRHFQMHFMNENDIIPIQMSMFFPQESNEESASIDSGNGLAPNRQQAITWTNDGLIHLRIYAALGGDELIVELCFEHSVQSRPNKILRLHCWCSAQNWSLHLRTLAQLKEALLYFTATEIDFIFTSIYLLQNYRAVNGQSHVTGYWKHKIDFASKYNRYFPFWHFVTKPHWRKFTIQYSLRLSPIPFVSCIGAYFSRLYQNCSVSNG